MGTGWVQEGTLVPQIPGTGTEQGRAEGPEGSGGWQWSSSHWAFKGEVSTLSSGS